ncbi:hypothetical protein DL93DRAFT_1768811 [Clavulina sp. PMI_390]|nr:hypothetical protein DL93DRAFT_1768811 [Clavulina sp. PMI_390]
MLNINKGRRDIAKSTAAKQKSQPLAAAEPRHTQITRPITATPQPIVKSATSTRLSPSGLARVSPSGNTKPPATTQSATLRPASLATSTPSPKTTVQLSPPHANSPRPNTVSRASSIPKNQTYNTKSSPPSTRVSVTVTINERSANNNVRSSSHAQKSSSQRTKSQPQSKTASRSVSTTQSQSAPLTALLPNSTASPSRPASRRAKKSVKTAWVPNPPPSSRAQPLPAKPPVDGHIGFEATFPAPKELDARRAPPASQHNLRLAAAAAKKKKREARSPVRQPTPPSKESPTKLKKPNPNTKKDAPLPPLPKEGPIVNARIPIHTGVVKSPTAHLYSAESYVIAKKRCNRSWHPFEFGRIRYKAGDCYDLVSYDEECVLGPIMNSCPRLTPLIPRWPSIARTRLLSVSQLARLDSCAGRTSLKCASNGIPRPLIFLIPLSNPSTTSTSSMSCLLASQSGPTSGCLTIIARTASACFASSRTGFAMTSPKTGARNAVARRTRGSLLGSLSSSLGHGRTSPS